MFYIILSLIAVVILLILFRVDKVSRRFIIVYLVLWYAGLIISSLGLLGFYKARDNSLMILSLHLVFFVMGYCFSNSRPHSDKTRINKEQFYGSINKLLRNKWFIVVLLLFTAYVGSSFLTYYKALAVAESIADVRGEYFSKELYGPFFSHINNLFLTPFSVILLALFSFATFEKRNWVWVIMGIALFFYMSLSGGRGEFVNIFFALLFFYLIVGSKKKINQKKARLVMLITAISLYFIVIVVTAGRVGAMSFNKESLNTGFDETNEQIVGFISGPVIAFDLAYNDKLFIEKTGGLQYGQLTFASAGDAFYYISIIANKFLSCGIYDRATSHIGESLQETFYIGVDSRWNALYTSCIYYYLDFGLLGILVFPFFFGILSRTIIVNFIKYSGPSQYIISCMVFIYLTNSILRFFFIYAGLFFLLCLLWIKGLKSQRTKQ